MTDKQMIRRIKNRLTEESLVIGEVLGAMYVAFSYGPDKYVATWHKSRISVCRVLQKNGLDNASYDWWASDVQDKLNAKKVA